MLAYRSPVCHGDVNKAVLEFISSCYLSTHPLPTSNMSRTSAKTGYCRYRVNGKECPDTHCQATRHHDDKHIEWWIKNRKHKPCQLKPT